MLDDTLKVGVIFGSTEAEIRDKGMQSVADPFSYAREYDEPRLVVLNDRRMDEGVFSFSYLSDDLKGAIVETYEVEVKD
jgi:hypothetical protein